MRISDWSSDVCSSDLVHRSTSQARRIASYPQPLGRAGFFVTADGYRRIQRASCQALWQLRAPRRRSEEHTSELQSLMRISYAVFCLKKKNNKTHTATAALPVHN